MCAEGCRMCRWCEPSLSRLVAERVAADNGERHDLDDVIVALGMTRADLEADDQ